MTLGESGVFDGLTPSDVGSTDPWLITILS
jgi:hypothetical protein